MNDRPAIERTRAWLLGLVHENRLSPTQRRTIHYMLDSLADVAFASTVDVAAAAGVSQPTVTRLATALGFSGYPEFRSALRDELFDPTDSDQDAPVLSSSSAALASEQDNIASLEHTLSSERMTRAVDVLAGTQPLGIVGLRASSALAEYFGYFARRVLPDVHVLNEAATLDDGILQLHRNGASAVLAFVMPRYPSATVRALADAKRLGMATVAIVDTPLVSFADDVDSLLVAPVGTDLVFDSHAASIVLAISLLDAIAGRDARRTQERLEEHEELVERWAHPER
ncbi:MurR/RpiR family transcriptional regulator [Labedella phragmitis]|uniref:MurR/RpiR family transcriptional regulator n=1 Tax=Labedella phragmitis TaxID=2498849 RepID=A0A444PYI2_9MICO|nr:MurR/RpiR family transcriptional regulator [Labedella phragmitis]RWZ52952.1 MurR/RpiR family transcriptional regulator [Labedella phragmitis]